MSGWHSLSGYLHYKSGNNALGRLITKRKVWCVLEESKCELHYYKTEEDFHKHRAPQGHLDITGAAISLDLENQNQFAVICDGKEHIFTAENHESMMIWLLGLQAKRDLYSRKKIQPLQEKDDSFKSLEADLTNRRPSLFMTCDLHGPELLLTQNTQSSLSTSRRKYFWDKYENHKWGESVDSGIGTYKKRLEASRSFPLSGSQPKSGVNKQISSSLAMLYQDNSDSDDVFGGENIQKPKKAAISMSHWKKLQSAVMGHMLQSSTKVPSESTGIESGERQSLSSRSMSSDSAIEKGEGTPRELSVRLTELEKDLIATKCELAKVLNRQTGYQELLHHKDETIKQLEVGTSKEMSEVGRKSNKKVSLKRQKSEKEFNEKIRVLQNQNRFLNEEVKKLAKIRLQEHGHFQEQNSRLLSLEAEIEKWKMDYVCLIQSSIRYPGEEGIEDLELCLYGGDKHKKRVQTLLEEARKINPRLPTFESLSNNEVHVDTYGFKHVYSNTGLLLHYLCTELTNHYLVQAGVYEDHQKRWTMFMRQHGKDPMPCKTELKILCRGGIPDRFRKQMWRHLVQHKVRHIVKDKGDYYYRNLCNLLPESPLAACYRKQVSLDLMRTMPSNIKFSTMGSKGIMDLQDVLLSFCVHNPTIGYCQGMNFIVGMSLLFMEPEDAFWTLVAIAECYFSPHYFDHNLIGAQADQQVLKDMVKEKLPRLFEHLEGIDIELSTITLNWFLAVFFDAVPFQTLLRIWDCFLLEGPKVLFRFSLAILKLHENDILQKTDTMGIMKHLKTCAKLTYDVEGLVKLAFEGLKPFPKRKDIVTKETCYLNALKEKHKKKELQRLAFAEREQLYMSMEAEAGIFLGIECAVAIEDGKIWVCYGDQHIGHLCFVSSEHGTMISMEYKLDSRMMCMCPMGKNRLVLGTLSWMLVCLEVNKQEQKWQMQLHDAILSVCCYEDEDVLAVRIFAGLADGTVAVTEKMNNRSEPNLDVIYIPIGQAPVTCTMLLGDQLWCASGNSVAVIHARTLDTMDIFSVSINPYDHILSLIPSDYGIWISLRGSSILELWDPKSLNCRMLYDTRTDRYPQLRKEDDAYFNRARITSMLAYDNTIWVGTGEGNMIIYEVVESAQLKTPTDLSPSVSMETASTKSYIARPDRKLGNYESTGSTGGLKIRLMEDREPYDVYNPDNLEIMSDVHERSKHFSNHKDGASYDGINTGFYEVKTTNNRIKPVFNRRSSSETDMAILHATRYLEDNVAKGDMNLSDADDLDKLSINIVKKVPSANDIGIIEARRSVTDEDYLENGEELECEMEARARRESLTLMYESNMADDSSTCYRTSQDNRFKRETDSSRRSSLEIQNKSRKSSLTKRDLGKLKRDKSEDSGCESRSKSFFTRTSDSSMPSYKSCVNRKVSCHYDSGTADTEDVFEAELEKAARRESLKTLSMDPNVINMLGQSYDSNYRNMRSSGSDRSYASSSEAINDKQDMLQTKQSSDNTARSGRPTGYDDNPTRITENLDKEYFTGNNEDEKKRTTALGLSIDSDDGTDRKKCENEFTRNLFMKSEVENYPSPDDQSPNFDKPGDRQGRRRSVIDDISQLCSECKKLEKGKCDECSKLLTGQEYLKQIERRLSNVEKGDSDMEQTISKLNGIVKGEGHGENKNMQNCNMDAEGKTEEQKRDLSEEFENEKNLLKNQRHGTQPDSNETGRPVKLFPESRERKDLTRQEKVGYWLSAISQEDSLLSSLDNDVIEEKSAKQSVTNGDGRPNTGNRCSYGENGQNTSPKRPKTLELGAHITSSKGSRQKGKFGSTGSDDSSAGITHKSSSKSDVHYNKDKPGVQYRLDFSGAHVETDVDSENMKSGTKESQDTSMDMSVDYMLKQSGIDSRKNSLDLGIIQENCKRLEKHGADMDGRLNGDVVGLGKPSERQRIFEFLKTPSLATRHMSLGLKIIDNDLEWTDLFTGQYTTPSPGSSTDKRLADFLRTPTISSRPSSLWSSYENISTPSQQEPIDHRLLHPNTAQGRRLSHSASTASIGSENDLMYNVDLNLEAKVKISDKPVKCLLATRCKDEPIIMSFSGSYGDDEAVLKWRKHKNEQLWTNEPILELCPKTRAAILPSYMRRRLSSNSSFTSHVSVDSGVNLQK